MRSRVVAVSLLLAATITCAAQSSIREDAAHHQWILNTGESTYVIGFNDRAMLQSLYWGPKLPDGATLPEARMKPERASFDPPIATTPLEYPAWGGGLFTGPPSKSIHPTATVRSSSSSTARGAGVVWRAGLERKLAHDGGEHFAA